MKTFKILAAAAAIALPLQFTQAAGPFDTDNLYVGGGLSSNSLSGFDSAMGYQIFAGIPLAIDAGSVKSAVEVGYMNSGEFKYNECVTYPFIGSVCADGKTEAVGLWANYVASMDLTNNVQGIARVGLDFGDDDGLMYGIGAGYGINKQMDVRGEYVVRDNVNSLQVNLVYRMK